MILLGIGISLNDMMIRPNYATIGNIGPISKFYYRKISLLTVMDNIPQEFRDELANHQYTIRGHLPNVVGNECGFAGFQKISIKNALFPVEGKSYLTFELFVLYYL